MRAKSFHHLLRASILLAIAANFAVAAPEQHQTHLAKNHASPLVVLKEAVALLPAPAAKSAVTPQEMDLFGKIAAGHLDQVDFSEAVLAVAGVTDAKTHQRYLAKIEKITDDARMGTDEFSSPDDKANFLVAYLRKGPLSAGPQNGQYDVLKILDGGKFNCVSSAILYTVIGTRLGLKTNPVSVPDHVFLHLGKNYIEPTLGLTYAEKNHQWVENELWKTAADYWKSTFGTVRHYESNNMGLLGSVYFDQNGALIGKHQYDAAAIVALKAICLNSEQPVFTYSLKLDLQNWFRDTLKQKDYAKAQKIAAMYGQLFGDDSNDFFQQVAAARSGHAVAKS